VSKGVFEGTNGYEFIEDRKPGATNASSYRVVIQLKDISMSENCKHSFYGFLIGGLKCMKSRNIKELCCSSTSVS